MDALKIRTRFLAIANLLGAAVLLLSAQPTLAVEYGGIGGRPAYPQADNPRTASIFIHQGNPGQVIKEGVRVINNTAERKVLEVYATDSAVSSGGAFACAQAGDPKKDVGDWISLDKTEVTLPSLANQVVPFTIKIPETADVGEHNGCIVIQEEKGQTQRSGNIILSFRTGLRVAMLIPGEITRKLEIAGFDFSTKPDGTYLLHPRVKNLGNVSIDSDVQVITRYFFGPVLARHGGQLPVLRGEISDWNFELAKPFWGGLYRTSFAVEYDDNPEAGVGVKSGQPLTKLEGPSRWFFVFPAPWALVVELLVLLLVIAGLYVWRWSVEKKRRLLAGWVSYKIKTGDNVKSLAERFGVSWKLLAKINKLKAPYALKVGGQIKVPPVE